jgi:hypothetical protein
MVCAVMPSRRMNSRFSYAADRVGHLRPQRQRAGAAGAAQRVVLGGGLFLEPVQLLQLFLVQARLRIGGERTVDQLAHELVGAAAERAGGGDVARQAVEVVVQ